MDAATIQKIIDISAPHVVQSSGLDFADKVLTVIAPDSPEDLTVRTLSGICLLAGTVVKDAFVETGLILHVVSHSQVDLLAEDYDKFGRRHKFAGAGLPDTKPFPFDTFLQHEPFVIGVQSLFVDAGATGDDREYVLKVASNLTNEQTATSLDDGVSQQVGLRTGVTLKEIDTLKRRVKLSPYRTFREVKQPVSEFVFRVQNQGPNTIPKIGLFEADGGNWRLDAVASIAGFLKAKLPSLPVIV